MTMDNMTVFGHRNIIRTSAHGGGTVKRILDKESNTNGEL